MNSFSFKYPKTTDFIKDKLDFVKPWQNVGVDYAGPIYLKFELKVIKSYLLVFMCLGFRAINIEFLLSMTCKDFLIALIRFCNAQSMPESLYSDNANIFINVVFI